ncbi:MAG: hypothetical protein PHD02_00045 [Bacilli bacterium]|nr:hypothetical protein [Bacilli bacterium]
MNNDFFEGLEQKEENKPMTDKEVEDMAKALSGTFNNYQVDKKNIYQIVSIILIILGVIVSFILSVNTDSPSALIIGIAVSFVSGLFMYGFGEIIRQLKIANTQLSLIKKKK